VKHGVNMAVGNPDFGYTRGQKYTLRWPPPGLRDKPNNWCEGDQAAGFVSPSPAAQRGFIDIGDAGGMGSDFIRQAIISEVQSHELKVGDQIIGAPGNRGTESDALRERYDQDTDERSGITYAQYMTGEYGNGRRFVIVPVNDPTIDPITGQPKDIVLGFAGFFMTDREVCGMGENMVAPCCAEYVGPALVPGRRSGGGTGAYKVKLFQ
jgi:hypothetical protein